VEVKVHHHHESSIHLSLPQARLTGIVTHLDQVNPVTSGIKKHFLKEKVRINPPPLHELLRSTELPPLTRKPDIVTLKFQYRTN
jgi:Asp/Glu/hydantoin racemase